MRSEGKGNRTEIANFQHNSDFILVDVIKDVKMLDSSYEILDEQVILIVKLNLKLT